MLEIGDNYLNFLDVTIINANEKLEFNLYHKPIFSGTSVSYLSALTKERCSNEHD